MLFSTVIGVGVDSKLWQAMKWGSVAPWGHPNAVRPSGLRTQREVVGDTLPLGQQNAIVSPGCVASWVGDRGGEHCLYSEGQTPGE